MIEDKIYSLQSFQRQFEALVTLSVCDTIQNLTWHIEKNELLSKIDWNNMLSIASILSYSKKSEHLDAALRIAQTCLTQKTNEIQKTASVVILENLTNKQALELAVSRNLINADYTKNLPLSLKLQSTKNRIENSVYINAKVHPLNRFQKEVYLASENNDTLSISAPTSAGKSFILSYILLEQLLNHKGSTIVYIVPTRALISQVEYDLRKLLKEENLPNVNISTVPQHEEGFNQSNIFVFTQERLHWFLTENPLRIDLLLVDEAQKIDDSNRGILLQQKIEEVVKLNSSVRVFFSSPFTSNPELLFENVKNDSSKDVINTQFVAVNQNLIYTSQIPRKPQKWNLTLALLGRTIQLGTLDLKHRPSSEAKKIALIAESHNSKMNLIYSNGAADAEKYSLVLFDLLPKIEISQRVKDLINLVRKTVHPDYALVKVLSKGIAFHYGNMPLLIRQEIEALFKEGDLNYLICTSTLLEGVNLPAKSIFIRKPKRGKNTDLNENDFWNLAGRAGRWGKEFSGNIICIEPTSWKIKPNPNKSKQKISRAIDLIETDKADELVQFIIDGSPREMAETRQDLEFAFGYYYNKFINNELDSNNDFHKKLDKLFKVLKNEITIPNYILVKNPGISPIAQQQLLNYFIKRKVQIENMIPVYPEDSNNLDEYTKLVERIGETISFYHPQLSKSRAILLINWMSGKPLSYLIRKSFESYQRNEKYKNIKKLPVVIRETMEDVENFVRFKFAKDSTCYIDILRFFLQSEGKFDLVEQIPQLNLWLEFGVSQKTQVSLLSLGLTRNTVIELSEFITNPDMTKDEALQWIKESDLNKLGLSSIILNDIFKILITT